MKVSFIGLFGTILCHACPPESVELLDLVTFKPSQIAYADLANEDAFSVQDSIFAALRDVGMFSISGIPNFNEIKSESLSWDMHACAKESRATQSHVYRDGTHRLTLATQAIPGGAQKLDTKSDSTHCKHFEESSDSFRNVVNTVLGWLAIRLSSVVNAHQDDAGPLLETEANFPFASVFDIIENGEHLEHFHSYQRIGSDVQDISHDGPLTIDMHTDQGMLVLFTPGRIARQDHIHASELSADFIVELQDGTRALVDFDDTDELVVLLGDGVNQYINPRLPADHSIRAVPHALAMRPHSDFDARLWYGRMVLPPSTAIHPQHGRTFGEIRKTLIVASIGSDTSEEPTLGCAQGTMVARQLEEMSCEADTLLCWHKCMSLAEFNVSQEICAEQGKGVFCINPRGQLSDGTHGDFNPGCATNDTEIATPYPTLPDFPRNMSVCTNTSFLEFASMAPYDHQIELGGSGSIFLWNFTKGQVHGRIVFNGLLGFLAVGLANVGGDKNGMHGAHILMAIPGGDYSPVTGFNLSMSPSVQEYRISSNPDQASFRYWGISDGRTAEARYAGVVTDLELTECYSSFTFEADGINGVAFNASGTDQMLWAANNIDSFAGYHGLNRGRFSITWATGQAELYEAVVQAPTATSAASRYTVVSAVASVALAILTVGCIGW